MQELEYGLTDEELEALEESAKLARVSCEGGSEGNLG